MKKNTSQFIALLLILVGTRTFAAEAKTVLACDNVREPQTGYIFEVHQGPKNLIGVVKVISDGDMGTVYRDVVTFQEAAAGAKAKGRFISARGHFVFVYYGKRGYLKFAADEPQVMNCGPGSMVRR